MKSFYCPLKIVYKYSFINGFGDVNMCKPFKIPILVYEDPILMKVVYSNPTHEEINDLIIAFSTDFKLL